MPNPIPRKTEDLKAGTLADLRVVIVEDDPGVRAGLALVLADWGCRVLDAESLGASEERIRATSFVPDVLVTDLHLTGSRCEPSFDAIHRFVTEIGFDGPVIVVTGDSGSASRDLVERSGWLLLLKPFRPGDLCQAVARVICPRTKPTRPVIVLDDEDADVERESP